MLKLFYFMDRLKLSDDEIELKSVATYNKIINVPSHIPKIVAVFLFENSIFGL